MMATKLRAALPRGWRPVWVASAIGAALAAGMIALTVAPSSAHTTSTAIPATAAAKLRNLMIRTAKFDGDAHPAAISAVATTVGSAMRTMAPGVTIPGMANQRAYLVVFQGNFTLRDARIPPGAHAPTGRYLCITINPATFRVIALNLRNKPPAVALRSYGPVTNLIRQP